MEVPKVIWVTAEDHGSSWSGAYRAFRASSLDHGGDYPKFIRADAPELVELVDGVAGVLEDLCQRDMPTPREVDNLYKTLAELEALING